MAKLTISEASRQTGVARTTLYRDIEKGRISLDPDRCIDTAELLRVGYTLRSVSTQEQYVAKRPDTPVQRVARQPDTRVVLIQQERDLLQRERDLLQQQLDAALAREREVAERERDYREQIRRLSLMLQDAQQRYDRLLEAPRDHQHGVTVDTTPPESPGGPFDIRQRILDYMRQYGRPISPAEVQQALRLNTTPRHVMRRMADAGTLRRVEHGIYELA
jgi:hypothetical protein